MMSYYLPIYYYVLDEGYYWNTKVFCYKIVLFQLLFLYCIICIEVVTIIFVVIKISNPKGTKIEQDWLFTLNKYLSIDHHSTSYNSVVGYSIYTIICFLLKKKRFPQTFEFSN